MPREERTLLASLDKRLDDLERQIAEDSEPPILSPEAEELVELAAHGPSVLATWRLNDPDRRQHVAEAVKVVYASVTVERLGTAKRWSTFHVADYKLNPIGSLP